MVNNDGRTKARLAVTAELARREWSPAGLATESGADPGTIGDFINGKRWIKLPTQGKIERALEWPSGAISSIEAGVDPGFSVSPGGNDDEEFGFLTRVREDLTTEEMEALMAESQDYLKMLVRDIKRRRG